MSSIGLESGQFSVELLGVALKRQKLASDTRARFERLLTISEMAGDLSAVTVGAIAACWLHRWLRPEWNLGYGWNHVVLTALGLGVLSVVLLDRDGAYRRGGSLLRIRDTERVLRVSVILSLAILAVTYLSSSVASWMVIPSFALLCLSLLAEKQVLALAVRVLHRRGFGIRKVLIYGAGYTGRRVVSALMRSPKVGLAPIAVVDDNPALSGGLVYESSYRRSNPVPVVAGPLTEEQLRSSGAEMLAVAIPSLSRERFLRTLALCTAAGVQFTFVPGQAVGSDLLTEYTEIDGLLLSSFAQPVARRVYENVKRGFDILIASMLLLPALPLFLAIALLVRIDSDGPALFRQKRVGRNGRLFEMYKFRTMYAHLSGDAVSPQSTSDPRITPIGRILRRSSMDELPQLLNVLKGDMSLVGPRPEMPFIVAQYCAPERQRLQVMPGITGLWQLSADRAFRIHENIQYDLYYIRNRGFFMDLAILLHTAVFAMRGI